MKSDAANYAQSVMNAAALKGIMDDARWVHIVNIVKKLLSAAQSQAEAARNNPSFDAMIKSTHFDGQVRMAKILLHTLTKMYEKSDLVLKDARTKLPYAPTEQRRQRDPDASRDTHKEDNDAGRQKEG